MPGPKINSAKCTNCGKCIDICPMNVFEKENDKTVVKNPDKCIACRACEIQCAQEAIKVSDE